MFSVQIQGPLPWGFNWWGPSAFWSFFHGSWSGSARWAAWLRGFPWPWRPPIAGWFLKFIRDNPKITWMMTVGTPIFRKPALVFQIPPKLWCSFRFCWGEFELKRDYLVGISPGRSELWHRLVVVSGRDWDRQPDHIGRTVQRRTKMGGSVKSGYNGLKSRFDELSKNNRHGYGSEV